VTLNFYDEFLDRMGNGGVNLMEVGVLRGGATLAFLQRLPNARILGIDLADPPPRFWDELDALGARDRFVLKLGSQADRAFLHTAIRETFRGEKVDMVIDDAFHAYAEARATFEEVFVSHVRPGGVYAIEDWGTGYFIHSHDGHPDGHRGLAKLVKEIVDEVALPDRTMDWQGERSVPGVNDQLVSPVERAVLVNGVAAFLRGEGDWMPPLGPGNRIDPRVIRRDIFNAAKAAIKRVPKAESAVKRVRSLF
jgi:hypothetical protein